MLDTTQENFARDVLAASHEAAVLVDFWAPGCGPCKTLTPLLSAIEADFHGRLKVIKLNVDENQELASRFGVRSIPFVIAFVDGKPVDSFVGVLPAESLRRFVGRLLPDPAELERRKASKLCESGDHVGAASALRAAIALDPARDAAQIDLAALLLEHAEFFTSAGRLDEADGALAGVSPAGKLDARWVALHTQLQSQRRAAELPTAEALRQQFATDPGNLQARLDLASLHVARREFGPALEQLLAIVERDRSFGDDIGRRTMLSVFDLAADEPQLVSNFRKRLASALNR